MVIFSIKSLKKINLIFKICFFYYFISAFVISQANNPWEYDRKRAETAINKGKYKKAIRILDSLHKEYPKNCTIMNNIVLPYTRLGIIDSSMKYSKKILEHCKNDTFLMNNALVHIGKSYYKKGNRDKAYEYFNRAVKFNDTNKGWIIDFFAKYHFNNNLSLEDYQFCYELQKSNVLLNRELSKRYWSKNKYFKSFFHYIKYFYIYKILGKTHL